MILGNFISAITNGIRKIKANIYGAYNPRTAAECSPYGFDSNPIPGVTLVFVETSKNGNPVVVGYINTQQLADTGESRMYATDGDGTLKTWVWCHNDGTMEIGGNANHMTQYEGLDSALQNDVITKINVQLDLIATGIAAGGGSYTPTHLTLDISGAKLTNIKTQ